jgi:hypothetical protein
MSFNVNRYGEKLPNASGEMTISLDDLDGVSPAQVGETLQYDAVSDTWSGAEVGTGIPGLNFALFGQGQSDNYTNSTFSMSVGETLSFYDSSPINHLSSHVTFNYVGSTYWLESITLAAGKYDFFAQTDVVFSSSGYFGVRLKDSTGAFRSELALIGDVQTTYGHPTAIMCNVTATEQITVSFAITNAVGVSSNQATTPSQHGVILIRSLQ